MAAKLLLILMENCVAEFLNRRNTEKVSLSCMDFHNGFHQKEVNQDTVVVLFVCDWHVKSFSPIFAFSGKLPKQRGLRYTVVFA